MHIIEKKILGQNKDNDKDQKRSPYKILEYSSNLVLLQGSLQFQSETSLNTSIIFEMRFDIILLVTSCFTSFTIFGYLYFPVLLNGTVCVGMNKIQLLRK